MIDLHFNVVNDPVFNGRQCSSLSSVCPPHGHCNMSVRHRLECSTLKRAHILSESSVTATCQGRDAL